MKLAIVLFCLAMALMISTPTMAAPGNEDMTQAKTLAQAQNAFAADLFAQVRQKEGNLFFSPYSIATAMSMTYLGAKGDTAAELAKGLHLNDLRPAKRDESASLPQTVMDDTAALHALLNTPDPEGMQLRVANALWGKANYPFNPDFIKQIKGSFDGNLTGVDFSKEEPARKLINDWVAEQTKDKIKDLIAKGVLTPDTRLVLTNAIYFKAAWEEQFKKEATKKEPFHLADGKDADAEMMKQNRFYALAELDGFKMLALPYKGHKASMLVLLPDKVDGLADVEKSLTAAKLAEWVGKLQHKRVNLSLPKFKSTSSFELSKELGALGIRKAFQAGGADFTGIANVPDEPLYIALVIHKAFVEVNEEGTEAAAATAVVMKAGSAMRPEEPVKFTADHPFLYIIRDDRTGDILFLGRLADPTQKE